jgi:hypothetical protein
MVPEWLEQNHGRNLQHAQNLGSAQPSVEPNGTEHTENVRAEFMLLGQ